MKKDVGVAYLLLIFLGLIGGHKFYIGKIGMGIFYILTLGGFCGLLPFIDLFLLAGQVRRYNETIQ